MSAVTLGLDLATSSARCVALEVASGAVLTRASSGLPAPVRGPSGVSRQRSAHAPVALRLVEEVCAALGPRARDIVALSVTGTSGTVVPCDDQGAALGDARLYDDSSGAAALADAGVRNAPVLGRMLAVRGEGIPARFGSTADVVAAALVGRPVASDTSHLLKAGIDLGGLTWPTVEMRALGLPTEGLPPLVPPGTVLGRVDEATATRLGLGSGVRVVAGMTDGCTAQIAAGAVHDGDSMGVLGTTLVLKAVCDKEVTSADGAVYSHLAPDGRYWAGGASNTGAGVLADEFPDRDLAALDAAASGSMATLVRYPLSRPGERFPVADPDLPPLASGRPTDEVDAYRSVLDGVAFVERLGLETLAALAGPSRRHVLAGGATASAVWNRIRATVLAPLAPVCVAVEAGSGQGAAILAAHAALSPHEPFGDTVDRLVAPPVTATPPDDLGRADNGYHRFLDLLAATGWHPHIRR